jgi:hypothetical protein
VLGGSILVLFFLASWRLGGSIDFNLILAFASLGVLAVQLSFFPVLAVRVFSGF